MGVKLIGFEKLETKLTKKSGFIESKSNCEKKRCAVAENGTKECTN